VTQPMSEGELWPELRRSLQRIASGLSNAYDREQIETACAIIETDQRVRERLQAERDTLLTTMREAVNTLYPLRTDPFVRSARTRLEQAIEARAAVAAADHEKGDSNA